MSLQSPSYLPSLGVGQCFSVKHAVCSLQHWWSQRFISPDWAWTGLSLMAACSGSVTPGTPGSNFTATLEERAPSFQSTSVLQSCGIMTPRCNHFGFGCWKWKPVGRLQSSSFLLVLLFKSKCGSSGQARCWIKQEIKEPPGKSHFNDQKNANKLVSFFFFFKEKSTQHWNFTHLLLTALLT